jgi:hypothetical protein
MMALDKTPYMDGLTTCHSATWIATDATAAMMAFASIRMNDGRILVASYCADCAELMECGWLDNAVAFHMHGCQDDVWALVRATVR